ncbi:cytochrome c oxidase subunit II [Cellvibrio fibrivorans]|uniref:Cytochrome c oxidase subunit 2 n=1 Tax=Cellvibrio fibrivorans TaxID=126350 RepID=A0ABU1US61_9GAMM|nr:cytochrome c oxidase subunit II [Cellvibrio fibrivorans]MDR7088020.1 cytochrome c oxidase subunit 2 [Cellvibrio fibrivorans]
MKRYLSSLRCVANYPVLMWMLFISTPLQAQTEKYNMTRGATDISHQVYDLHMAIFYICCVIGAIVFALMFWSIIYHRKSKGAKAEQFHGSLKIELLWTAIPVVILVVMAIPASKTLIAMEDASKADLTVLVTGSQWKWHYKYMEYPIEYYSMLATPRDQIDNLAEKTELYLRDVDKPLVLPTGKKIRFLVTADDVIHAWWVPAFAIKKDANPGFINETWTKVDKPGIYRGQCAELCGKDHGFMPVVVDVRTPEEFDRWAAEQVELQAQAKAEAEKAAQQTQSMEELMALGEKTYESHCAMCHQISGEGLPGAIPALKGSAMVTQDISAHIHIVVYGKPATAMQAFAKQLTTSELAAVITYERNAWGNNTGDLVQVADVAAAIEAGE